MRFEAGALTRTISHMHACTVRRPLGQQLQLLGRAALRRRRRRRRWGRNRGGARAEQPGMHQHPSIHSSIHPLHALITTTDCSLFGGGKVALAVLLRFTGGGQEGPSATKKRPRRDGRGDRELLVVNTHLKAAKTAEGEQARAVPCNPESPVFPPIETRVSLRRLNGQKMQAGALSIFPRAFLPHSPDAGAAGNAAPEQDPGAAHGPLVSTDPPLSPPTLPPHAIATRTHTNRAARPHASPQGSSIPILLCGDFNARPPPRPKDNDNDDDDGDDYPPEAMPILLNGEQPGRGLQFRSLYDLDECVRACVSCLCGCRALALLACRSHLAPLTHANTRTPVPPSTPPGSSAPADKGRRRRSTASTISSSAGTMAIACCAPRTASPSPPRAKWGRRRSLVRLIRRTIWLWVSVLQ